MLRGIIDQHVREQGRSFASFVVAAYAELWFERFID